MENAATGARSGGTPRRSKMGAGERERSGRFRRRRGESLQARILWWVFFVCAMLSVVTTVAIVFSLLSQAIGFFREVPVWDFLTGTRWTPILRPRAYGVLPLINGTLIVAAIAALVALPVGLATAIFLAEYAPEKARRIIKPTLEVLAGVPTVVYGYFALTFVTPLLQRIFPDMIVFNALSARRRHGSHDNPHGIVAKRRRDDKRPPLVAPSRLRAGRDQVGD